MRFLTYEIEKALSYAFFVGTSEPLTTQFKAHVREQIDTAMSSFNRVPTAEHSVGLVHSEPFDQGDDELPKLERNRQYLIFALLDVPDNDVRQQQDEIAKTLEAVYHPVVSKDGKRIGGVAVVVLNRCSVQVSQVTPPPADGREAHGVFF